MGEREPFDFYFSAFLNAAYTVDERLRRAQEMILMARGPAWDKKVFGDWRKAWRGGLSPAENDLITWRVGPGIAFGGDKVATVSSSETVRLNTVSIKNNINQ